MFLKEVVIDGFKSYATRTVVPDFDPSFNAITGLNGSGKSNVLDSICFVLGITNLSQVRASSLQELVYKGGLAGVSKATVSLVFNNTDKSTAPVGYEQPDEITVTRQIVIGGRNKYLINGINAQPGRVQNLFHSVGLNVNNPHFLIMQGRITKVINMKPPEVLSMIEEAAGTKMYENKKEGALRTIEKKQRKVDEINSLLEEKINPSLAKLERERRHYIEWNQNNNEVESLKRYLIAYSYFQATQVLERSASEESEFCKRKSDIEMDLERFANQHASSKRNLNVLMKDHAQHKDSGTLEDKQQRVDILSKKFVKLRSVWTNQSAALENETKSLKLLEEGLSEQKKKAASLSGEAKQAKAAVNSAVELQKRAANDLEMAEKAMLTGTSSQDAEGAAVGTGSIIDQLETARRTAMAAQTEIESIQQQKSHLTSELQMKSAELAQDRANIRILENKKRAAEKAVADAKFAVHELDFDPSAAEVLNSQLDDEKRCISQLAERVDYLSARLESCDFNYSDPYPNFDRRKVHGLVARLIRVKDVKLTTAIEVTAGGRLYQVVVDNDGTAHDLLQRGRLVRRVTILPLNKIRHDVLSDSKLHHAKKIEPSTELALSLVGYDLEVTNAIEHVFGRTLICPDMDAAKRVTFDDRVKTRTVTLEGDTYDPSGTASGGSSTRQGPSVLVLLGELKDAEAKLSVHRSNAHRLSDQVAAINERGRRSRQLQATLAVREEEARQLDRQLEETATGRLLTQVELLRKTLSEDIPVGLQKANETLSTQSLKIKDLEQLMKNSDAAKKREEEEAQAAMVTVRKAHEQANTNLQTVKNKHSALIVDLEATNEEISRLQLELEESVRPAVEKLQAEVQEAESSMIQLKESHEQELAKLKDEQNRILASNRIISDAKRTLEELSERIEALNLDKAKVESKLREMERGQSGAKILAEDLNRKHSWISQEREMFGTEGSDYDFNDEKCALNKKTLESLEQRQEGLSKRINKKAMHMFETAKEEYQNLMKKKTIIEQDKQKIEMVIAGLDEKKMVAVEETWRKVNEDFGNIFSDLLPGTSAKLKPPEGGTVNDGLEICVAFGGVWKDSLSELSGGQRSLIALSLILAMLRFKPAPMYILDEVDAALDLSHTQNIGRMLRRHFSGSQFIVVSLKEGMFSNANVIFRTKFVDGVSTIKRSQNQITGSINDKTPLRSDPTNSRLTSDGTEDLENSSIVNPSNLRKRRAVF